METLKIFEKMAATYLGSEFQATVGTKMGQDFGILFSGLVQCVQTLVKENEKVKDEHYQFRKRFQTLETWKKKQQRGGKRGQSRKSSVSSDVTVKTENSDKKPKKEKGILRNSNFQKNVNFGDAPIKSRQASKSADQKKNKPKNKVHLFKNLPREEKIALRKEEEAVKKRIPAKVWEGMTAEQQVIANKDRRLRILNHQAKLTMMARDLSVAQFEKIAKEEAKEDNKDNVRASKDNLKKEMEVETGSERSGEYRPSEGQPPGRQQSTPGGGGGAGKTPSKNLAGEYTNTFPPRKPQ